MSKVGQEKKRENTPPPRGRHRKWHPPELRLKAVQLYLEEGIPTPIISQELGIGRGVIFDWVKRYKTDGENGLRDRHPGRRQASQPASPRGQREDR